MDDSYDDIITALRNLASDLNSSEPFIPDLDTSFITPAHKINGEVNKFKNILKIGHLNAVSLPLHRDEIQRLLYDTDFDIVAVSETNIKKSTPSLVYKIEGYQFFHVDRNHTTRGGVGIFVKNELTAKKIQVKYDNIQPELLFIEIETRKNKILVGVLYKSPKENYTVYGEIVEILAFLSAKYKHVLLLGDYNINQLTTDTPSYKYFKNTILEPLLLTQLIKEPTRITRTSSTLLDLLLVNSPDNVKCTGVVDIPGISDHCFIYCAYALKKDKFIPKIIRRRDFRNFVEEDFKRDMETAPWGNIYSMEEMDIDNQATIIENIFQDVINKHAPFRNVKVKKPIRASWLSDDIIKIMDKRDKYKNKYNLYKSPLIYDTYKELKNKVNHMIREAKYKDMNKTVNDKINDSRKFHQALKDNGIVNSKITSETECKFDPNSLNENFVKYNNSDIDAKLLNEEVKRINSTITQQKFEFRKVTEREVKKAVKSLKTNSCGTDDISTLFIKLSIDYSVHAITEIINASLKFNYFPRRWKKARIKPIPKCQYPKELTDFRPISLLIVFSKILEKLVAEQMKSYFEENQLFDTFQSAYREHHSTTTALLEIMECINAAMDNSEITILTLLDYSKAFDCANHKLIIAKLKALGFKETALKWIESYLNNRSQQVITDKGKSTWKFLRNGVPQGSILGPLLFTILISDIGKTIKYCTHHCYADDTQLFLSGKINNIVNLVEKMNHDLNSIARFSNNNFLQLNSNKSTYIIIGSTINLNKLSKVQIPPISINNKLITRNSQVRNLGVIFDETLNFDKHVNTTISKAFFKLKQVYRFKNFLSMESKKNIVEAYILAHFNYCDVILSNISKRLSNKIQKFQNCCTRFIFGLKKFDHISDKFKSLGFLNMDNRRKVHALTTMHKIINKRGPKYLYNRIEYTSNLHYHNTRGKDKLIRSKARNNYGHNSFFNITSTNYNSLTDELDFNRNCTDQSFKINCKKHFLKKQ